MSKTLKQVLVDIGKLDRYFDGHAPIDLFRAYVKADINEETGDNLLEAVEKSFLLNGRLRQADITIEDGKVKLVYGQGVSLADHSPFFKSKKWIYFVIPANIELPEGLALVRDRPMENGNHYSILPTYEMPISVYRSKLKELGRLVANHKKNSHLKQRR